MNTVVTHSSLKSYFSESIEQALRKQQVSADAHTIIYLSALLENFAHTKNLFDQTEEGLQIRPLAMYFADAASAETLQKRTQALRKLGDIALFISAIFSESLARKPIDIDYYVAMGGSAYSHLYSQYEQDASTGALTIVYFELSSKFVQFMDVLSHINQYNRIHTDLLRQYEIWHKTGSQTALNQLRSAGIDPVTLENTTCH